MHLVSWPQSFFWDFAQLLNIISVFHAIDLDEISERNCFLFLSFLYRKKLYQTSTSVSLRFLD